MKYKNFTFYDFERIPRGGKINARRLELETRVESSVFVFSEKPGLFQCILPSIETTSRLPEVSGLQIRHEQYSESGSEMGNYVLLECGNSAYLKQFTEIIKDILTEYDNSDLSIVTCLKRVIEKWRHFLSAPRSHILHEDDILGLLGELVLLKKLIEIFGVDSIGMWRADQGEEDFIGDHTIIEVKATLKEKHQHVINGIDQLNIVNRFDKYVLSLLFIKSVDDINLSLPFLTEKIGSLLSSSPVSQDTFYQKLKARGYDIRDASEYTAFSYAYYKGAYFHINESFPKLTTDSLAVPLSPRISKIRYTLDFEGLACFDFAVCDLRNRFLRGL